MVEFDLKISQLDDQPFDPMFRSFCLSFNALEAGLYFFLHPVSFLSSILEDITLTYDSPTYDVI